MRAALVALALIARGTAEVTNPNFVSAYSAHATQLRSDLLAAYDKVAPPTSTRHVNYSEAGTDVELNVRFYKLDSVDVSTGRVSLKVWFRLRWRDTRLSWQPEAYGGITLVRFQGASFAMPEDSEIWLPDVTPYNTVRALMETLRLRTADRPLLRSRA